VDRAGPDTPTGLLNAATGVEVSPLWRTARDGPPVPGDRRQLHPHGSDADDRPRFADFLKAADAAGAEVDTIEGTADGLYGDHFSG